MIPRLVFAGCVWLGCAAFLSAFDEPRLSILPDGDDFVVAWPGPDDVWVLEAATNLPPAAPWGRVTAETYQTNGVSRFVRVPATGEKRFFRLRWDAAVRAGLTAAWRLDEGDGASAGNAGGVDAALTLSGTSWGAGRIGEGGLRFDGGPAGSGGTRAWVSNTNFRLLPGPGAPFSVSLWFNPEALTAGWRGLAGNNVTGTNGWVLALNTRGPGTNELVFSSSGEGGLNVAGRTLLLPGQWHHVTATHDGAQGSLYLDGALLARGSGAVSTHDGPVFIGGGVGGHDSFLGRMDEVRAYAACLSADQISLAGHWRFDEQCGAFAGDSGLDGHHAQIDDATGWAPGRAGGGGAALGQSAVTISNLDRTVLPPDGAPFSVSFWICPRALPEGKSGLMHCGEIGVSGWQLAIEMESTGAASLHWASTNHAGTLALRAPLSLSTGVWTRLDLTHNGAIAALYANGRKIGTDLGAIRSSRAPFVIGTVPAMTNFSGVLDDLKVFRHERGAAEIGPTAETMWETVLAGSATNWTLRGAGPSGRTLVYALSPVVTPTNGTVTLTPGSSAVTYTAGPGKGPDAFAYTVSDGEFTSLPAIVAVSVVTPHWLCPAGGTSPPLDGTSPERAWPAGSTDALDTIWRTNNYYDCFFYAPGEYVTRGYRYGERVTANRGCKHVGAGSAGPNRSTIKLVDALLPWAEGAIFSFETFMHADGFECHDMALDANGNEQPNLVRGEPQVLRFPLETPALVDAVTLRWLAGQFGRASQFTLTARRAGTNTFATNVVVSAGAGLVDVLSVGADADELVVELTLRAPGVLYYALGEIEVSGAAISLPKASVVPGGTPSQLDLGHPAVLAVDGETGTAWASGVEAEAQITLPLAGGTVLDQVHLHWNCKTLPGLGRLGPAAGFAIRARNESTGQYEDVPFVRHGSSAGGFEICTFGTALVTNSITTDRVLLLLTNRAQGVDFYSLREATFRRGGTPVPMRLPSATSRLDGGTWTILQALDGNPATSWACHSQGTAAAIHVGGSNIKLTRLAITGFGGRAGRECFSVFVGAHLLPGGPPAVGNVLIEDCLFTDPATNNTEGVTVLQVMQFAPLVLTNSLVRRCQVVGLRAHFPTTQAFNAPRLEDCVADDCHVAVYYEPLATDRLGPVLIRSNRFLNVSRGVFVASHASAQNEALAVIGNEFVLTGGGLAFGACDACNPGPSGTLTNVVALGNIIRFPDWASRPADQDLGLGYGDMQHAIFANNIVALGTANGLLVRQCPAGVIPGSFIPEDCERPGVPVPGPSTTPPCVNVLRPGYRRAWLNNRSLTGQLLEVRTHNFGVSSLAAEQQWPE